jgi:LysM repeat protein
MKILRIFGIVLAVHAFAFILIFANPGCSTKPRPTPTPAATEPAVGSAPATIAVPPAGDPSPIMVAQLGPNPAATAIAFDPNAPATSSAVRYSPTRPSTAAAVALQAEPVTDFVPANTITVAKGDNLWNLAKKNGLKVSDLATANNLKTGTVLHEGQKLIIPSRSGAVTATAAASGPASAKSAANRAAPAKATEAPKVVANSGGMTHVVKLGESLGMIAKKYGVKQGEIAVANNISNPALIREGQELVIPGWQAPKASKPANPAPDAGPLAPSSTVPMIGGPASGPGLNSGPASSAPDNVPVIKVEDSAPPKN